MIKDLNILVSKKHYNFKTGKTRTLSFLL